jgi:hypothetical protein
MIVTFMCIFCEDFSIFGFFFLEDDEGNRCIDDFTAIGSLRFGYGCIFDVVMVWDR